MIRKPLFSAKSCLILGFASVAVLGILVSGGYQYYLLITRGLLISQVPNTNEIYEEIAGTARKALREQKVFQMNDLNCDVQLVGVPRAQALASFAATGLDVQLIERIDISKLTDKSESLYIVHLTGHTAIKRLKPEIVKPRRFSLTIDDKVNNWWHWLCIVDKALGEQTPSSGKSSIWECALIVNSSSDGSGSKFNPSPDYQMDTFSGGNWLASFAAWNHKIMKVSYTRVGSEQLKPTSVVTKNLNLR